MNNLERAQRDWENPPDEEEAKYCGECGEELEWKPDMVRNTPMCSGYWECTNSYCPEKFEHAIEVFPYDTKTIVDMANELVETKGKLESTQESLYYVRNSLASQQQIRERREKTIEELEKEIDKAVAQSQSKEVVRDTEYQIRRMEDCIEYAYIDCGLNGEGYRGLKLEWNEVVKILRQI
jgi:hypothetical protein